VSRCRDARHVPRLQRRSAPRGALLCPVRRAARRHSGAYPRRPRVGRSRRIRAGERRATTADGDLLRSGRLHRAYRPARPRGVERGRPRLSRSLRRRGGALRGARGAVPGRRCAHLFRLSARARGRRAAGRANRPAPRRRGGECPVRAPVEAAPRGSRRDPHGHGGDRRQRPARRTPRGSRLRRHAERRRANPVAGDTRQCGARQLDPPTRAGLLRPRAARPAEAEGSRGAHRRVSRVRTERARNTLRRRAEDGTGPTGRTRGRSRVSAAALGVGQVGLGAGGVHQRRARHRQVAPARRGRRHTRKRRPNGDRLPLLVRSPEQRATPTDRIPRTPAGLRP
jgi:hypothetical protein